MLLFLKIAATLVGCYFLWYKLKNVFDFKYHDIEVEELELEMNDKTTQQLVTLVEKNVFGKIKTTKYYIANSKKIIETVYLYDNGEHLSYDKRTVGFSDYLYPNRDFLHFLRDKILAYQNKKIIHQNVEKHYSKIMKNLDKELNLKFENLEKEKAQAAKIKARIGELTPEMEQELIIALNKKNAKSDEKISMAK